MPKREVEAEVYLDKSTFKSYFTVNQYDDVELKIIIKDICSLENKILILYIGKPQGEIDKTSKLKTVLDNITEFIIKGDTLNEVGIYKAQLKVIDDEGGISSSIFAFNVNESIVDDNEPIPPPIKTAICGTFECGELNCGEGLEIKEVKTISSLSKEFLEAFGGGLNE
ncbi:hypothetical protein V1657_07065 [Clostridium perfringens]|uniref:hypothetical protein n=1 Tax=Clostridium perfringens TaxID=1502 RepID=UPI002ED384F3|nr:hypothetical protein V1657_07065 [Clostridium perfringens]